MKQEELQPAPASFDQIFAPEKGVVQAFAQPHENKNGHIKIGLLNNMGIVDSYFHTDKNTPPWEHVNNQPLVEMNFIVEGNIYQSMDGFYNRQLLKKGSHSILFNPGSLEKNELQGYGAYRNFSVHLDPVKMTALLMAYVPAFEKYAEKITNGQSFLMESPGLAVTDKMKYIFDTIWECPDPEGLKKLYLESKVLDLLSLQCETLLSATVGTPKGGAMPAVDIDKLYAARALVLSRLDNPPSIATLARLCLLNEFKLKKGFRELFNTTVFGYVNEMRLTRARQMIREGQQNISGIAYSLGYSHPQHFQRAFKKQFGITPGSLLK